MKMYDIFTFMLSFNIILTVAGSMGIWSCGFTGFTIETFAVTFSIGVIATSLALIAGATLASKFANLEKNWVYLSMSVLFGGFVATNMMIFKSIDTQINSVIPIYPIMTGVLFISWIFCIYQMASGGFRTYV